MDVMEALQQQARFLDEGAVQVDKLEGRIDSANETLKHGKHVNDLALQKIAELQQDLINERSKNKIAGIEMELVAGNSMDLRSKLEKAGIDEKALRLKERSRPLEETDREREELRDRVLEFLNELVEADPAALHSLCEQRVYVNKKLENLNSPVVLLQGLAKSDQLQLGIIGIINGILGEFYKIAGVYGDDGKLQSFKKHGSSGVETVEDSKEPTARA
jgi:DNA-directed RNA polymerase subunit F